MKFLKGNESLVFIKFDADNDFIPIGCLTSNTLSEQTATLGTTIRTNQNGWTTSLPTTQSYSINLDGYIPRVNNGVITYNQIARAKRFRVFFDWRITLNDDPDDNIQGRGFFTSLNLVAPEGELQGFTATIQGFGEFGNLSDGIYEEYVTRTEANGAELSSEVCTLAYIEELLTEL